MPRPLLPNINDEQLAVVKIHKRPVRPYLWRPTSEDRPDTISVIVPDRLTSPHQLVSNTLIALKSCTPDRDGILRPRSAQCLDVSISRNIIGRAMRVMDALLKALEKHGYPASIVERDRKRLTCVQVLGETIEIQLRELLDRREKQFTAVEKKERERSSWLRDKIEYEYSPSGRLTLNILNYLSDGCRRVWSDGKKQRLEIRLDSVINGVIAAAESEKALRLQRERWEKERVDREQERLKEAERRRKEEEKIGRLEHFVNSWKRSQGVREFLTALEQGFADKNVSIDPGSELGNWLSWARNYADSIDPIVQTLKSTSQTHAGAESKS